MNFAAGIFGRANIQQIRSFILDGVEDIKTKPDSYEERINKAKKRAKDFFRERYPDNCEFENVINEVYRYVMETENVYMEMGLQCGILLSAQIMAALPAKGDIEDGTI